MQTSKDASIGFVWASPPTWAITALGSYREVLPTHFQFSWLDALGPQIVWDDMIRGTGLVLVYASLFLLLAWTHFQRKDITS